MRVDFMIIGAAKCGTTSLASLLASHPRICFSRIKEPHFFSRQTNWQKHLDEYHALFNPEPGQILGEGSPYYTLFPEYIGTEKRIFDYNPNTKLIYIIRNPIDRIYSNYRFVHAFNNLRYPLQMMEKEILENPMYLNRTRYHMQIKPYIDLFGRENVHICLMEDFVRTPDDFMEDIYAFLQIPSWHNNATDTILPHQNKTSEVRNLTKAGNVVARLPGIYQLPKPLKWKFRSLFEVKMNRFLSISEEFRSTLIRMLEPDLLLMSDLIKSDILTLWGLNPSQKLD